jgi:serine/threonine protein phosphatase 1
VDRLKTFVMGDIHGAHKALVQCLERSKFDSQKDRLIFLGDVVDGWPESRKCVDELLSLDNLVPILGNHDQWFLDHCNTGWIGSIWVMQGGEATLKSYQFWIPRDHHRFFKEMLPHYILDNKLFVHGGYVPNIGIDKTPLETKIWDRVLHDMAMAFKRTNSNNTIGGYDEIYIGHTATIGHSRFPIKGGNIWLMDQGAGWRGYLTIMDIDTNEYWQSDFVPDLYPNSKGRRG